MLERRILILVSALVVFLASAALWNAFVRRPPRGADAPPVAAADSVTTASGAPSSSPPPTSSAPLPGPAPQSAQAPTDGGGPSYIVLLARSEIRRRIRASAGLTYLNEIVAASPDSEIHRWEGRVGSPVRVLLAPSTTANFQPAFLDQVRAAFQRWIEVGVPVRFTFDADTSTAEVRFQWRIQFDGEKSGQTELQWDDEGKLTGGTVTLATFDPKGQPLGPDDVRVIALHEIGHLLGLDHSHDTGDILYAQPKVRDLSPHDIATVQLLY
ncbi:MAG TPA: matrixin family metalloprotease, partial [Gemmatimonadales bacterium]|nr:matrixin family metalloprotease [Gemmatimonadales bacterium]